MTSTAWTYRTTDGLTLHATVRRHPAAGAGAPVVLCLPGLTRNERDFEGLAGWLTARGFAGPACEVIALSLRGRGASERDPNFLHYHPSWYVADVIAMMDARGLDRALFVGTSLGGIVTMLLAATSPGRIAGAVLNDVGPELAPAGLQRIATYVGGSGPWATWDEAAQGVKAVNEVAFPQADETFWRIFARRTCTVREDGQIVPDYDKKIADALMAAGPIPPMQPGFQMLNGPLLCVRGALSDLLTPDIVRSMKVRQPAMEICEVDNVGHAPTLEEPQARKAIETWLEQATG